MRPDFNLVDFLLCDDGGILGEFSVDANEQSKGRIDGVLATVVCSDLDTPLNLDFLINNTLLALTSSFVLYDNSIAI